MQVFSSLGKHCILYFSVEKIIQDLGYSTSPNEKKKSKLLPKKIGLNLLLEKTKILQSEICVVSKGFS